MAQKNCEIKELIDGGIAIVDCETGEDLWCSWENPVIGAFSWCMENGYTPVQYNHMDVIEFDRKTKQSFSHGQHTIRISNWFKTRKICGKVIMAAAKKTKIKTKKVTRIEIDSYDLDKLIYDTYGHDFQSVACEEWGNDSVHDFTVEREELADYDLKDLDKFKTTGYYRTFMLGTILTDMCNNGHLKPGKYLVSVCW